MKIIDIKQFEKIKINPIKIEDLNNVKSDYTYCPKTKDELRNIIKDRIFNNGYKCNLNDIDVSNISDFSKLFAGFNYFNGNVSDWNVSNATNMSKMFINLVDFNCDISNWNVSKVTNMSNMFSGCYNFNQNLNNWDVSNVIDMTGMFAACYVFNKSLDRWYNKISQVTSMERMFYNCHKFDQDLSSWIIYEKNTVIEDIFIISGNNHYGHYNVISNNHKPKII